MLCRGSTKTSLSKATASLVELGGALHDRGYKFTTVTPSSHSRVNQRKQNLQARSLEDVLGWSRPFPDDCIPQEIFALLRKADVLDRVDGLWRCRIRASTLQGELFFHSAFPTTSAEAVFFGPDTYRFCRALREALKSQRGLIRRIVDIGCGSGAGGIIAARLAPNAEVVLTDINDAALQMAAVNLGVARTTNVIIVKSDLLDRVTGDIDLIIANPPYLIDPLGRTYRHGGGEHGEKLSLAIVDSAIGRLAPGGSLFLYTGSVIQSGRDSFAHEAGKRLREARMPFEYDEIDPDVFGEELDSAPYNDADRIAVVLLTARRSV